MVPPQPGDSGMTPADQAEVQQFVERYVHQLKTEGAIRSPAVERASAPSSATACSRPSTTDPSRHRTSHWSSTTPSIPTPST
jgi:hypothetical protein